MQRIATAIIVTLSLVGRGLFQPCLAFSTTSATTTRTKSIAFGNRVATTSSSGMPSTPTLKTISAATTHLSAMGKGCDNRQEEDRREMLQRLVSFAFAATTAAAPALAADGPSYSISGEPIIWKSGKTPVVPGKKPKDKNDTSGTKKDGNFLRSVAQCKNQCENTTDKDGYARSKEECLSDCQDICCTTYEQCTFGIVPRI